VGWWVSLSKNKGKANAKPDHPKVDLPYEEKRYLQGWGNGI
jgi:hypothetical protein